MMKRVEAEHEIIRQALHMFQRGTRLIAEEAPPVISDDDAGFEPDIVIKITTSGKTWRFPALVQANVTMTSIGAAIGRLASVQPKGLLLARYVNPNMAEALREKDIQFLDTAGNAYLNAPPLFIFIKGNRTGAVLSIEKTKRAFRPSGLQVLFVFLLRPALVTAPYREIANAAGVALGTVGWVMRDLKELGFLVEMGSKGRRLTRMADLLNRWVTAYPEQLRPKLLIGRFRAANPSWQEKAGDITLFGACWGGEPAAARITGLLKYQTTTVYAWKDMNEFLLHNKLRKDLQGDIEIMKAFWSKAIQKEHGDQAPPLVVYADLLATADTRNIEIARVLYEQKINGLIRED